MSDRSFQVRLLPFCILASCALVGCTTEHVFEFKDTKSDLPIRNAPVEATSCHRIYSYLDLRHYLAADSGKSITRQGRTDEGGKVALSLPSDLSIKYVCLDGKWFAREPSSAWQPMLTQQEYEARAEKPGTEDGRPLVRMETK